MQFLMFSGKKMKSPGKRQILWLVTCMLKGQHLENFNCLICAMTKSSCCKRGSVFNIRISGGKFWKTFHVGSILLHFPIILYDSIKLTLSWLLLLSWALCPKSLLLFVYPHFNLCFRVIYKASSMKPVSRSIDGNFKEKKTWKWRTDWIFTYFRKFNNGNFH